MSSAAVNGLSWGPVGLKLFEKSEMPAWFLHAVVCTPLIPANFLQLEQPPALLRSLPTVYKRFPEGKKGQGHPLHAVGLWRSNKNCSAIDRLVGVEAELLNEGSQGPRARIYTRRVPACTSDIRSGTRGGEQDQQVEIEPRGPCLGLS